MGNKEHQKHEKLSRPRLGEWGRSELAMLGAPCGVLQDFAHELNRKLLARWKIALVDADHRSGEEPANAGFADVRFTDKISHTRVDFAAPLSPFQKHALFNDCDLVLVNGNHFHAKEQIIFIHPAKSLERKLDKLSDVRLVVLAEENLAIPEYLQSYVEGVPRVTLGEWNGIAAAFENYLQQQVPTLNGLVLAGGNSTRMDTDKGSLNYHGIPQRDYAMDLLQPFCEQAFLSCNAAQRGESSHLEIEDRFLGIGPMGGILSAMQSAPDAAWLVVACDLPHLTRSTLEHLVANRDSSKMATAFKNSESGFVEPLITIWEPRAYPILLQALSEGITCPRKVLMHAGAAVLPAPDSAELKNVNNLEERSEALAALQTFSNVSL